LAAVDQWELVNWLNTAAQNDEYVNITVSVGIGIGGGVHLKTQVVQTARILP
jgi:hypothetical protein